MHITNATVADAHYLKTRLRASDRSELKAAGRTPIEGVVPKAFATSRLAYTVRETEDGKPLAMYGVAPTPDAPGLGIVWMLSTPGVNKVAKSFLSYVPQILADFHRLYPQGLHNVALFAKSNLMTLRWLKACGFSFGKLIVRNGKPFQYFYYMGA